MTSALSLWCVSGCFVLVCALCCSLLQCTLLQCCVCCCCNLLLCVACCAAAWSSMCVWMNFVLALRLVFLQATRKAVCCSPACTMNILCEEMLSLEARQPADAIIMIEP